MATPLTITEDLPVASKCFTAQPSRNGTRAISPLHVDEQAKWGWACRRLEPKAPYTLLAADDQPPRVGDVAVVTVESITSHTCIVTSDHRRMRLYAGDQLVGVFGNRYATDAFEAEVRTTDPLHLLTSAGMIGTVLSHHRDTKRPTGVRFAGYLANPQGQRINLKKFRVATVLPRELPTQVVLAVGTGMNSGKTTTAAKLVKALVRRGTRVAACKLTGSVCHRDLFELRAASPQVVSDFSDYGFPSTYQCDKQELIELFNTMVGDCLQAQPNVIVMEIADGVLQRETEMLLADETIRPHIAGVVLAAPCSSSALFGLDQISRHRHAVIAVSGVISNSPLFMREFAQRSDVPLADSTGNADQLAELLVKHCRIGAR